MYTAIRPISSNGRNLTWIAELRYIGIYYVKSRTLKCSVDAAKRGFYRAVNSIFGNVILGALPLKKCSTPYYLQVYTNFTLWVREALPLNKSQLSLLDVMVNRFLMKLFNSNKTSATA